MMDGGHPIPSRPPVKIAAGDFDAARQAMLRAFQNEIEADADRDDLASEVAATASAMRALLGLANAPA